MSHKQGNAKAPTEKTLSLEEKVQACVDAEGLGRESYAYKDKLLSEIALEVAPGDIVTSSSGERFLFVDNFAKAKKNKKYPNPTLWAHSGARRWELEAVKPKHS